MTKKLTLVSDYPTRIAHPWNDITYFGTISDFMVTLCFLAGGALLDFFVVGPFGIIMAAMAVVILVAKVIHGNVAGRKYAQATYEKRKQWWEENFGVKFNKSQIEALQYRSKVTIYNDTSRTEEVYSLVKDERMNIIGVKVKTPNVTKKSVTV